MIQIYGTPRSSAGRCYLVLEEIGLAYQPVPVDFSKKENRSEPYLKLNPNGKVPCLVDDGFVIWESMAINHYLADKYSPELLGRTPQERGLVQQWSLWALLELQTPLIDIFIQQVFTPEDKRDHKVIENARAKLPGLLTTLDQQLSHGKYLLGDSLSLGDLNLISVVNILNSLKIPFENYGNLLGWFNRIKDRPSFQRFVQMRQG